MSTETISDSALTTLAAPVGTSPPPTDVAELADPTPLAFAAVGLPFGLICLNLTGIMTPDLAVITLPLALIYGTIGLLIAGLVAFRKGDTFGAFTYSSFSAFFLSFGMIQVLLAFKVTAFAANGQASTFATFLAGWAVIITYLMILSFTYPRLFTAIFGLVWITLILLAIGFASSPGLLKTGAWLGLVVAALCLYGSAAMLTNIVKGRQVLPIGAAPE